MDQQQTHQWGGDWPRPEHRDRDREMRAMLAEILRVGEGTCAYCRRPIEQALTVRFPEGTTRVFCQRDALKQILMRGEDQAEETPLFNGRTSIAAE